MPWYHICNLLLIDARMFQMNEVVEFTIKNAVKFVGELIFVKFLDVTPDTISSKLHSMKILE